MKIDLKWDKPIRLKLKHGSRANEIYRCPDLDHHSGKAGVYVFARKFGKNVAPLYIGQASRLQSRLESQFNNLRLMMGVKNAHAGRRILLVARLRLKRGQRMNKVLDVVESALIKHSLAQGHDLLNQQGTKTSVHIIKSKGNISSRQVAPLTMLAEKR
ncbi:MAG: hypothetical protein WBL70_18640 [Candidatus Acidiferrales bacterium]